MRKIIYLGLLIVSSLLGTAMGVMHNNANSFGNADNQEYAQAIMKYEGFDTTLEDADIVAKGTIESINSHSNYEEYVVIINDIFKGNVEERISIRNYLYEYSYMKDGEQKIGKTNCDYDIGKSYVFVLQHISNVYEEFYTILSDVHIPLDDAQVCTVLSEELESGEDYVKQYRFRNKQGKGHELSFDYIESNDEEVIITESKYIARVVVQELYRSNENVDVYSCKVEDFLKGDMMTLEDNQIIIPFFKDTVHIGTSYVVCLNSDREDSVIYSLSSKNSLWEVGQFERSINTIK